MLKKSNFLLMGKLSNRFPEYFSTFTYLLPLNLFVFFSRPSSLMLKDAILDGISSVDGKVTDLGMINGLI